MQREAILADAAWKDGDYYDGPHPERGLILARKIGKNVVVVVEKPYELEHLIQVIKDRGIKPLIGFRVRLHSRGSGKWEKSGGVTSKFGLSTAQLLEGIKELKRARLLDCLKMFHFHIGS